MKKKKLIIIYAFVICLFFTPGVHAQQSVHDALQYILHMLKSAQDELYQQLDIDAALEHIGISMDALKTAQQIFDKAEEIYKEAEKIYEAGKTIYSYIGDPAQLANYINTEFTHSAMMDFAIKTTLKAKNGELDDADLHDYYGMLKDAEYAIRIDDKSWKPENQVEQEFIAAKKINEELTGGGENSIDKKSAEIDDTTEKFKSSKQTQSDIAYTNMKMNEYQAKLAAQWQAADLQHKKLQAQYLANQNDEMKRSKIDEVKENNAIKRMDENLKKLDYKKIEEERISFWEKVDSKW